MCPIGTHGCVCPGHSAPLPTSRRAPRCGSFTYTWGSILQISIMVPCLCVLPPPHCSTSRASAATSAAATTRTAGSSSASTAGSRPAGPGAIGPRNSNGTAATAPSLGPYTHSSAPRASPAPAARASPHDAARRSSGASGNGSPAQPCPSRSPAGLHVHQPDARASHGSAPAAPKPLASSFTNVPQPQLAARTRVAQDILGDSGPESRDYETHGSPTTGSTATTTSTAVAAPAVVAPDGPAPTEQDELCELAAAGIIVACQLDGSGVCDVSMRGITRLPSALSKFFRWRGGWGVPRTGQLTLTVPGLGEWGNGPNSKDGSEGVAISKPCLYPHLRSNGTQVHNACRHPLPLLSGRRARWSGNCSCKATAWPPRACRRCTCCPGSRRWTCLPTFWRWVRRRPCIARVAGRAPWVRVEHGRLAATS